MLIPIPMNSSKDAEAIANSPTWVKVLYLILVGIAFLLTVGLIILTVNAWIYGMDSPLQVWFGAMFDKWFL